MSEAKYSEQFDYKAPVEERPVYRLSRLNQDNNAGTTVTLTGATQKSEFTIAADQVFNLSRSVLTFNLVIEADAAGVTWVPADCLPMIDSLTLTTRNSLKICDIPFFAQYTQTVLRYETTMQDLMSRTDLGILKRSNRTNSNNNTITGLSTVPYTDALYLYGNGEEVKNAHNITYKIKMGELKGSIFELDKDMYMGVPLVLRINWAPKNTIGWVSDTKDNPDSKTTEITAAASINNLYFHLAFENNEVLAQGLKAAAKSTGLQILIPWVNVAEQRFANGAGTGTTNTVTVKYNDGMGRRLKKVYTAMYGGTMVKEQRYLKSRSGKSDVLQTRLNNRTLQDIQIETVNLDEYLYLGDYLKNTTIQNMATYQYNWAWIDDFSAVIGPGEQDKKEAIRPKGLPLDKEMQYDFYIKLGAANEDINYMQFGITERLLAVGNGRVEIA